MYKSSCDEILAQYGWEIEFNIVLRKWTVLGEIEQDKKKKEIVIGIGNSPLRAAKRAQKNYDIYQDTFGL